MRIITFFILLASFLFFSYKSEEEKRAEVVQIVKQKDTPTLLNDLYVGADGDIASLCRILDATPSTIARIRKGESFTTTIFEERIRKISIYYVENGQSFSKLRAKLDKEYAWYDSVLNVWKHHPWWFWTFNILVLIIVLWQMYGDNNPTFMKLIDFIAFGFVRDIIKYKPDIDNGIDFTLPYVLQILLFGFSWICMLIFSPSKEVNNDKYIDDINHTIERSF